MDLDTVLFASDNILFCIKQLGIDWPKSRGQSVSNWRFRLSWAAAVMNPHLSGAMVQVVLVKYGYPFLG